MASRVESKYITISMELLADRNMRAYWDDYFEGKLSNLDPETFLAYYKGTLIETGESISILFDSLSNLPVKGDDLFILKVNAIETFEQFENR